MDKDRLGRRWLLLVSATFLVLLLVTLACEEEVSPFTGVPDLYQPINGEILAVQSPYFDWSDVDEATRYHLLVRSSDDYTPWIDKDKLTESDYQAIEVLAGGNYQWKVRAGDNTYWGHWSATWQFTIQ